MNHHTTQSGRLGLLVMTVAVLAGACGPAELDELAPASLTVEPQVLQFPPDSDSEYLSLTNSGGEGLSFSASVTGESGGIVWLEVKPTSGVIGGGGGKGIEVRVANRDLLSPGDYQGKVTLEVPGLESIAVPVSMTVGQPVLEVDPAKTIEFDADTNFRTFVVRNVGAGLLKYTVTLPGPWLTTEAVLQKEIRSHEPQTLTLVVDRGLVPWYGASSGELVVSSNGLDSPATPATSRLDVNVFVDTACLAEADCSKAGYYCDKVAGSGECRPLKSNSESCAAVHECLSDVCAQGVCCNEPCEGQCTSCVLAGSEGYCSPLTDGTDCDDGEYCLEADGCVAGSCQGGPPRDCSYLDTPCGLGYCDEEADSCSVDVPDDKCGIEGECFDELEWHPELACFRCLPEQSKTGWSLIAGACFVAGECYALGQLIGPECKVCNPALPLEASDAADGVACADDDNGCTEDVCMDGKCNHFPLTTGGCDDDNSCTKGDICIEGACEGELYACQNELECTEYACDGEGGCLQSIVPGYCLIDSICVATDEQAPGTAGCSLCKPESNLEAWSVMPDGISCDDSELCTTLDHCAAGLCVGSPVDCDDLLSCTVDGCDGKSGECLHELDPDSCIIDGKCIAINTSPAGKNAQCKVCSPFSDAYDWSPHNEGTPCDDGLLCSGDSLCQAGECIPVGDLCDDDNECTEDTCLTGDLCDHVSVEDGTKCEADGIACSDDVCIVGNCNHPVSEGYCFIDGKCYADGDESPDDPCYVCSSGTNQETFQPGNSGGACDDGLYCTVNDLCDSGECSGSERTCPGDVCKVGQCDENLDVCLLQPLQDGTGCDDGLPCTVSDICGSGQCHGETVDCNDAAQGNPCMQGYCVQETGQCAAKPTAEDEFCEDGLSCTSMTVCQTDGTCGGGSATTDEQCDLLLQNNSPCRLGQCLEPEGCALTDLQDGLECPASNAAAQCSAGECQVLECIEDYDDCNLLPEDGCEAHLLSDGDHCGECNKTCALENAETACEQGQCIVLGCSSGFADCDDLAETGCEVAITSDPANCGGCGLSCGGKHPARITMCEEEQCTEIECDPGTYDLDNDPANGCEVDNVIWVDAWNPGDPDEDGSFGHPYDTIAEAVAVAQPGWVISVAEGNYDGEFEVPVPGLAIHGVKPEWVTVETPAYGTGILVTADDVTLAGMTITGGRYGLHFQGIEDIPLAGGLATNLVITGLVAPNAQSAPSAGIYLERVSDVTVSDVTVNGVQGGTGATPGCCEGQADYGGPGFGVWLQYSQDCVMEENSIAELKGGKGGKGNEYCDSGGNGGDVAGLFLEQSAGCLLQGNSITNLTGGTGGAGADNQGSGGSAGLVAGIRLSESTGNTVAGNTMADFSAGTAGAKGKHGRAGTRQGDFGLYLHPDSLANEVGLSNTFNGETVVYRFGAENEVVSGYELTTQNRPTNLGKIVILESSGMTVSGNNVGRFAGRAGRTGGYGSFPAEDGDDGSGILLSTCLNCTVNGNTVFEIGGGCGGTGGAFGKGGYGGSGVGIRVLESDDCLIKDNTVRDIVGGRGGHGGNQKGGQDGGAASGLSVELSSAPLMRGNQIYRVDGGEGGLGYLDAPDGKPGHASCVFLKHSSFAAVSNMTCASVGVIGTGLGDGVLLYLGQETPVKVLDSIVSHASGFGVNNYNENPPEMLLAAYVALHDCAMGAADDHTTLSAYTTDAPLFVDEGADDFHLLPESPCIDAGKSSSECLLEPAPNGCRVNMGAFGNTATATANPDANHCDDCPF